ncbi:MAG: agmatinase [Acidobacteria bacterium]|nr:agmatinase [Acidobacteriota bacterium]
MIKRDLWGGLVPSDKKIEKPDLAIVGIPYDGSCCYRKGAAFAPAKLRDLSTKSSAVTEIGEEISKIKVVDLGDIEIELELSSFFSRAEGEIAKITSSAGFTIIIGGDHSITIPAFRGFAGIKDDEVGIIYLDAHPDLWEEYDKSGYSHACTLRRMLEEKNTSPEHTIIIGARSFNPAEMDYIRETGLLMIPAKDCAKMGVEEVAAWTVTRFSGINRIYLSLDIDFLDPAFAPGTGIPVAGGMSTRFLLNLLEILFEKLPIKALDLVEISPPLDNADITGFLGVKIIFEVMGFLSQKRKRKGSGK